MLRITPDVAGGFYIQWADLEGELFDIYRSTSPETGYELLGSHIETPFFVDKDVNRGDIGTRYYYLVKGFTGGVEVAEDKNLTAGYNALNGVARKAVYENQLVLKLMGNPPIKILLKRRDGQRCPNCWNPVTKKVRFANCPVCNGTGLIGGYHNPIETLISREFSQLVNANNMLDGERVELSPINAWITNFPLVSPGDVVVDVLNHRFLIDRVIQRTHSQAIIRQILDLVPVEKGHPAYTVPVEWGVES